MRQNELAPASGSKRRRKRVGRGNGSGHGTYSCRGIKGQKAHSNVHPLFEGGQTPLHQRLPKKRGFTNIFRQEYATVNLGSFAIFTEEAEVTPQTMMTAGLVKSLKQPIKVLGEGELERPLVIKANKFSRGAKDKIMSAGGRVVEIGEFEKGAAEI